MLHPQKISRPSLQCLPFEQIDPQPPQTYKMNSRKLQKSQVRPYYRHQILYLLKQKYLQQSSKYLSEIDEILSEYFYFAINPIYQNFQNLPLSIFVCGYCKQPFFHQAQYLLHCFDLKCQVNHPRSTFFVYSQESHGRIKNKDIGELLSLHNITKQRYAFFDKNFMFFAQIQVERKQDSDLKTKSIYKCGSCNYQLNITFKDKFFKHCLTICDSLEHEKTTHRFRILQNTQSTQQFVNDISNFYLNINILALFDDSYIRINQNSVKSTKQPNGQHFCSNCKIAFPNSQRFLQHCLFECSHEPSIDSSHLIVRRISPLPKKLKPNFKQKYTLITRKNIQVRRLPQNNTNKKWELEQRFNTKYEEIQQYFTHIYFCASCQNFFSDSRLYLAHFVVTACSIEHPDNSHYFYSTTDHLPVNVSRIKDYVEEQDLEMLWNNIKGFQGQRLGLHFNMFDNKTNEAFIDSKTHAKCGKCGFTNSIKHNFIHHLVKKCKCPSYELNSHRLVYRRQLINWYEFKECLRDAFYCLQIMKLTAGLQFSVKQNPNRDKTQAKESRQEFFCGKCKSWLENKFQFLYHCLAVCNSIHNPDSSHFFNQKKQIKLDDAFDLIKIQESIHIPKVRRHIKTSLSACSSEYPCSVLSKNQQQFQIDIDVRSQTLSSLSEIEQENYQTKSQSNQQNQLRQPDLVHTDLNRKISTQAQNNQAHNSEQNIPADQYLQLYPNINFNPSQQGTKYYCRKCDLKLAKKQSFIDHIFACGAFFHSQSSHFIISNTKFNQINEKIAFNSQSIKNPSENSYTSYDHSQKNIVCGCGYTRISKLGLHMSNIHSWAIPKGTSHFIMRFKLFKQKDYIQIYLPIDPNPQQENDYFVCPCNPLKKLPYRKFAHHIVKRHEGKSPIFFMKANDSILTSTMELN